VRGNLSDAEVLRDFVAEELDEMWPIVGRPQGPRAVGDHFAAIFARSRGLAIEVQTAYAGLCARRVKGGLMGLFDPHQIANLVGQLGGDHQQAAQQLQDLAGQGQQVDTSAHGGMLQQMGIDPQQLDGGGYQQHLDQQSDPNFQGYQPGGSLGDQQPQFG